jgi:hypothetical protein
MRALRDDYAPQIDSFPRRRIRSDRHRVRPHRRDDLRNDNHCGEGRWVEPENHVRISFDCTKIEAEHAPGALGSKERGFLPGIYRVPDRHTVGRVCGLGSWRSLVPVLITRFGASFNSAPPLLGRLTTPRTAVRTHGLHSANFSPAGRSGQKANSTFRKL